MNEDFVPFDLAKKLKEKGFNCEYPFAMYNKYEQFCPLYSSDKDCFGIDDFDKHACIAPTISQVLKWLREEKNLSVEVLISMRGGWYNIIYEIAPRRGFDLKHMLIEEKSYEDAAIAGIEYVIDNLI